MGNQLLGPPADGVQMGESMNIIAIAREVGFKVDWQHADVAEIKVQRYVAFAHAVIKAHTEELIAGAGEPVAYKTDDVELYVREEKFGFYDIPLYTATQVAGAVAQEQVKAGHTVLECLREVEEAKQRIATLESTLNVALEALEPHKSTVLRWYTPVDHAIAKIKEVLK